MSEGAQFHGSFGQNGTEGVSESGREGEQVGCEITGQENKFMGLREMRFNLG